MIQLVDITYYTHQDFTLPSQVITKHKESLGYAAFLKNDLNIHFVKHLNYEGTAGFEGISYHFFRSKNRFWFIPLKTHRFIKNTKPDIVLVQGLTFPLQVITLKLAVGDKCRIMVQHHGEMPYHGIKRIFQKIADRYIDAYIFTARGNAEEWLQKRIIRSPDKYFEVLEASTYLTAINKEKAKSEKGFSGDYNFLWVGRLNANKDPLLVLLCFEKYLLINANAKLYMIYQTEELLHEIKKKIDQNTILSKSVFLVGEVKKDELPVWYSAADFYISGSWKEGSGYALIEAMACGCIPIVTAIPSFKKITGNGKAGFLYSPGDADALQEIFWNLHSICRQQYTHAIMQHFQDELSFQKIAADFLKLCKQLTGK